MHAWTGAMHDGPPKVGVVKYDGAYVMSGHSAVVHLDPNDVIPPRVFP